MVVVGVVVVKAGTVGVEMVMTGTVGVSVQVVRRGTVEVLVLVEVVRNKRFLTDDVSKDDEMAQSNCN